MRGGPAGFRAGANRARRPCIAPAPRALPGTRTFRIPCACGGDTARNVRRPGRGASHAASRPPGNAARHATPRGQPCFDGCRACAGECPPFRRECQVLDTERSAFMRECEPLERECRALMHESQSLDRECQAFMHESEILTRECPAFMDESETLDRECRALMHESESLDRECQAFMRESETLTRECPAFKRVFRGVDARRQRVTGDLGCRSPPFLRSPAPRALCRRASPRRPAGPPGVTKCRF